MATSDPVVQTVTVVPASAQKSYYELFIGTESGPVPVLPAYESRWDGLHLKLGTHRAWVDSNGTWRIKNGAPLSDTDGVPLGSGGGGSSIIAVAPGAEPPPGTPAGSWIAEV